MIRKEDVPIEWKWKRLGEICEIVGGRPRPDGEKPYENGKIPFVRMRDLGKYHLTSNLTETESLLNPEFVKENNFKVIKKGSILIPRSGSVALNHRAVLGVDACIVSHICALEIKDPNVNNLYLYYVLRQIDMRKFAKKTTGLDLITFEDLRKISVPLPSLELQTKIAIILEKADQLKRFRKESDELTDDYLNSMFLEMFGDPINDTKNWGKRKLKEFGKILTGNTPSRKESRYYGDYIEWIKSDNINTPDIFLTRSQEMLSKEGAEVSRTVPKRSVLVTCIAGSLSCIGNAAISDREVAFNQQINAIIPNEDVDEFFLYFLILNSKKYIQNHSTKSMKGMISKSAFESIPLMFPPSELQRRFGLVCKGFLELKRFQKQSKQQIDDLFDVLMQKAFRGELKC